MRALFLFLLSLFQGTFICKVLGFDFELTKTADWQYYGRCVDFTLKMNVSGTTPLSVKVLAPHVASTPQMRILESTFKKDDGCADFTGSYKPILKSRTSDNEKMDDLKIDLGNVTVVGSCNIEITVKFQVLKSSNFVNGRMLWPGFAVQYESDTVFATQQAVRSMTPRTNEPVLNLVIEPVDNVMDSSKPMVVRVKAALDCYLTSGKSKSTKITIIPPEILVYGSFQVNPGSIAVTKGTGVGSELVFETSTLSHKKTIDFNITFTISSSHTKQGRDIDYVTLYADAVALPMSTACPTAEDDFTITRTKSSKMYTPFSTCDSGPGVGSTDIAYQSFSAPSYGAGAGPDEARFTSSGAWKPCNLHKRDCKQYLQVSFKSMVKIRRFAIKGKCDDAGNDTDRFVKSVKVYHSNNGGIWQAIKQGSKEKIFEANINCKGVAIVPLPYDIDTKYIRIFPVEFENAIAMKVEFYGCKSNAPEFSGPLAYIPNRSLIAIKNDILVCSTGINREFHESSCFSSGDGNLWKAVHSDVKHVSFFNPSTSHVYGVGGRNGNVALRNEAAEIGNKWDIISAREFNKEKVKSGVVSASAADNATITDFNVESAKPETVHILPVTIGGKKWAWSGRGVHSSTDSGASWTQRVVWTIAEVTEPV